MDGNDVQFTACGAQFRDGTGLTGEISQLDGKFNVVIESG
jgi:hypothetical protein